MTQPTILIVDDNRVNRLLLINIFKKENYNLLEAESGEQTLSILEEKDIDLILLDVMMPVMDGFETCEIIKRNPRISDIPIIFVTALEDKPSKIRGLEVGGVDFLAKPLDRFEVQLRIKQHLQLRRLYKSLKAQNIKIKKDLLTARQVQLNLLPKNNVSLDNNFHFSFEYVPCDSLGGDFLDIQKISENKYLFYLADVSGHGVPSALITMFVKQFFDHYVKEEVISSGESIKKLNETMLKSNFSDRYLTLFVGIIDTEKNTLQWSSAGPNTPPFMFTGKTHKILDNKSMAVGWMPDLEWETFTWDFPKDSLLFLYSDAAIELTRPSETNQLGIDGFVELLEVLEIKEDLDYEEIIDQLLSYSEKISFEDDLTFVGIRS